MKQTSIVTLLVRLQKANKKQIKTFNTKKKKSHNGQGMHRKIAKHKILHPKMPEIIKVTVMVN
jgi:hypothetical protein